MQTMDYKEAAGFLKITEGTLRNWVSVGRIKPRKVGKRVLFFREELEAWITGATAPVDDPRPHPSKPATEAKAPHHADPAGPVTWNARFQLSFSTKAEGDPFAYLENMPGKSVKMTPDNMRELARYLVDAANMCETPTYRGIQHHRIMREPMNSLSMVCIIPHDFMHDLETLAHAATRTNDPHAATPEKYAVKFIADGLRAQQPIINQRLKERGSRAVHFISVR